MEKLNTLTKNSIIFEKELLYRLNLYPREIPIALKIVSENNFYKYGKHFSILVDVFLNNKNLVTEFAKEKISLTDLMGETTLRNSEFIASDLLNASNAIGIYKILYESSENVVGDMESFIASFQSKLLSSVSKRQIENSDINQIIEKYFEQQKLFREKLNGKGIIGTSTGYEKLDEVIDGLRPEHFWVIGGYASTGKTFASLNIVADLIKQGKRVVYYSIEMSSTDILSRLLGILTEQNGITILKGYEHNETKVLEAVELIKKSNIVIYTSKNDLSGILFSMYEETIKQPVDLFVVDFIQLMTVKNSRSEYETVTACATELQQTAKKLKVPIIALSQVSNDGAKSGENQQIMSFKGSGAIAAAADLAIEIIHAEENVQTLREKMKSGEMVKMKWHIRKNRHGRMGYLDMMFDGKTGRFINENGNTKVDF